jgi:hypothetical protein
MSDVCAMAPPVAPLRFSSPGFISPDVIPGEPRQKPLASADSGEGRGSRGRCTGALRASPRRSRALQPLDPLPLGCASAGGDVVVLETVVNARVCGRRR